MFVDALQFTLLAKPTWLDIAGWVRSPPSCLAIERAWLVLGHPCRGAELYFSIFPDSAFHQAGSTLAIWGLPLQTALIGYCDYSKFA
jgi:hypothetical protein